MAPSRTRWHRVLTAINNGMIAISTRETEAERFDAFPEAWSKVGFETAIDIIQSAPKFYFERDVMEALMEHQPQVHKSLDAMQQAGVARLPFPYMLVEYDWGGPVLLLLSESKKEPECPFRATAMTIHQMPAGHDVIVLSPQTYYVSPLITLEDGGKGMRWKIFCAGWLKEGPAARKLADMGSVNYWKPQIEPGLVATLLLLNTRGIERQEFEAPARLNQIRAKKGKPPIPSHSIIRIGHVYNREGRVVSRDEHQRGHQSLHWRAGYTAARWVTRKHERWVADRANDEGRHTVMVYVEPYLVNYDPLDATVPPIPERVVKW